MARTPPPRDPARRAVVTGLGAVTPIGNDVSTFWTNLVAGVSGVGPITQFDATDEEVRIAAEVKGFEPRDWIDFKQARRMSRFAQPRSPPRGRRSTTRGSRSAITTVMTSPSW